MHSLFVRIFVLFWFSMALIVGGSIAITYLVAAREYESPDLQRRAGVAMQASEVLRLGGLGALTAWLNAHRNALAERDLYIIGPDGRDILARRLPSAVLRRLDLQPPTPPPPGNFHPPHVAPQIIGPNGLAYTVLSVPRRPSPFGALSLPGISLTILIIALAVSALASGWLARHLSAPIRRIQAGARTLAAERPDQGAEAPRVSAGLEDRKDELAVLARDFDVMADRLRANRAGITRLLRDVSHELRSPLARMRLAVGLARQPGGDPGRQLERLEREIERLDALISQVLQLARLQSSDTTPGREEFDLNEVIDEVVRDASFEGAVKGCEVLLTGTARPATWRGDRALLSSAVENVLRNAVRYSPPHASVDVTVAGRAGGGIEIVVRDRGPGVPPGDTERIFAPFYRVAESRDRNSGGEGIGLAITAQVMKAHGGSAGAENHPGGGLEVHLTLGEKS